MGGRGSKSGKRGAGGGGFGEQEPITQEKRQAQEEQARQAYEAEQKRLEEERKKQAEQEEQKPTHARQIADMNEAQLEREIARLEQWTAASQREVDRINNSESMRFFRGIGEQFPGGVGGSAVDGRYRRMQERNDRDMQKLIEAQGTLSRRQETLQKMRDALEQIRGTGKTLRTVATATASKGSGTWSKTEIQIYGKPVKGSRMGDYVVAKPFFTYNLYDARTGKQIKTFKSKKAAMEYAEKQ